MYRYSSIWILVIVNTLFMSIVSCNGNENRKHDHENHIKEMIEDAGCPFHDTSQLIRKNVCLMPDYESYEPPDNGNGKSNVDTDLWEPPKILQINERKNKITIQLQQFMEWKDPRIRANISAMSDMLHPSSLITFTPKMVEKIWHPNLDMHTINLQDWKSLYHPLWFKLVGINKQPWMRSYKSNTTATFLFLEKDWRVTTFCKFDFTTFPFDTQVCEFRQKFQSYENVFLLIYPSSGSSYAVNITKPIGDWSYEVSGFEANITPIGTLIESHKDEEQRDENFGFDIVLKRIIRPYLFQYYFPCAAIVIVSHISFVIPLTSIPGRVALMVTQFLTLTQIFISQMVR